jgi:hypothetical protein
MIQGREVPGKFASEFMDGIDKDPKFMRFSQRQAAAETLVELRMEKLSLRAPDPRSLASALLIAAPLVIAAILLPWPWVVLGCIGAALSLDEVRARRSQYLRDRRLAEVDDQMSQLEGLVVSIDREAESSIRIIDPATFGAPKKQEEKRSNGS